MSRWACAARRYLVRGLVALLVLAPVGTGIGPSAVAAPVSGADAASAAVSGGDTIDLFYGRPMTADAWSAYDRTAFSAAIPTYTLTTAYNQWLAIADLREAYYEAAGHLEPGGVTVYPAGASAVIHVLDLALSARERALLWLLGLEPLKRYPRFSDLGYHDPGYLKPGNYIGSVPMGNPITPAEVGNLIDQLPLSPALFAGDRIFLMPYQLPQEYAVTDVYGPGIRIWIGATATVDLRHVLYHELGHAVHFRFGGFDTASATQPLSAFWRQYLAIRGLTWVNPTAQVPWAQRTIECFAEDFAYAFRAPGDILGYEAACPVPTPQQVAALEAFWSALPDAGTHSPYQEAQWVEWESPLPSVLFGGFHAALFTNQTTVPLQLSLSAQALGGPYTVEIQGQSTPLTTLEPGVPWSASVAVPFGQPVEIDANSPSLTLTWLDLYSNPAFVPEPNISGVFPDTIDSWARVGIAAAVRAGIVGGYPDGEFQPEGDVTRAQLARMLATGLPGQPYLRPPAQATYGDVPANFWAAPFVATVGADLPGVVPGGLFQPDRPLTRESAVAWTARVFGFTPLSPAAAAAVLATYPDGGQVSPQDAPWFAAALSLGLVRGDSGSGDLQPLAPLTRAEAAIIVMRAQHISAAQARAR